jgi:CopG family nickel-responsive transcriptional regulator
VCGGKKLGTVNISLPDDMVDRIDKVVKDESYASRSELVRDALRGLFSEVGWMSRLGGVALAVVTMTFNIERRGTLDEIGRIEHKYEHLILTSLHNHMGKTCLEVIITKGATERIKELIKRLKAVRGVEVVRATVV